MVSTDVTHELLSEDLYALKSGGQVIIYAPLRKKLFPASKEGLVALRNHFQPNGYTEGIHDFLVSNELTSTVTAPATRHNQPYVPESFVLSLTSACNLRCIYCYALGGYNPETMQWEVAQTSIDYYLSTLSANKRSAGKLLFHGGGEPTVAWKLLQRCVNYALEQAATLGIKLRFALITNGTLLTRDRTDWLRSRQSHVKVSLDGAAEVQNQQRPTARGTGSFDDAMKGFDNLRQSGVRFAIRTTVTQRNVGDSKSFARLVWRAFHFLSLLILE